MRAREQAVFVGSVPFLAIVLGAAPVLGSDDGEGGVEVVDPAGRPIANAKVTLARRRWSSSICVTRNARWN